MVWKLKEIYVILLFWYVIKIFMGKIFYRGFIEKRVIYFFYGILVLL